jgi:DNA-binding response OmpR family regulator
MPNFSKLKILIAEDETFMRKVVVTTLQTEGASVLEAGDGEDALRHLRATPVNFALLDVMMPRISGLQVLREIRAGRTQAPRSLPVGILTSANDQRTVGAAVQLDCDAFIVKPLNKAILFNKISTLIERGDRPLKSSEEYDAIPIAALDSPSPERTVAKTSSPGYSLDMSQLPIGMVLGSEIRTRGGDLVVPKGVTVTAGLIGVLTDLEKIVPLMIVHRTT